MPVNRDCLYCTKRFTATTERRLFCSDACKMRYNREERLTCFYCGEIAPTRDHITPQAFSATEGFRGKETVNCCRKCNSTLGAAAPRSIEGRVLYLVERTIIQYELNNPIPEWDDEEIEELGPNLRSFVEAKIRERQRAFQRLFFMKGTLKYIRAHRI